VSKNSKIKRAKKARTKFYFTILYRPFSKVTFEEARNVYEAYLATNFLPENVELISSKNCLPIIEHSLVMKTNFFDIFKKLLN